MRRSLLLSSLVWWLAGCGGYYGLTVPDQVAPAGGEAVVVARLQRNDFFFLDLPVREAAMQFQVGELPERGAYTDKLGYAGASVPVPNKPGKYELRVFHQDFEGEEVRASPPLYVWDGARAAVAVDLDGLPTTGLSLQQKSRAFWSRATRGMITPPASNETARQSARAALRRIAKDANILYLTRQAVAHHGELHKWLASQGYPDGPVLPWQRERWRIVRRGRYRLPQVVVDKRMVSQLDELRKSFPQLRVGVCTSALAAKGFAEAGLRCAIVGSERVRATNPTRYASWAELAQKGL